MLLELPKLPFSIEDIKDYMSEDTINYHYGKHHQAYANKANELMKGTEYESMPIEEIVKKSYGTNPALFNNAAQYYNHNVFWEVMSTSTDKSITPEFEKKIADRFGSFAKFKEEFINAAMTQFGSGWAWLVKKADGSLDISKTANGVNPLVENAKPLLGCDVWEHAYYLDYQNLRNKYVENFLNYLVNWKVVEKKFNE